jgi:hypothetical protein
MLRYKVQALKDEGVSNAFRDSVEKAFEWDEGPKSTVEETWHHFRLAIGVAAMAHEGLDQ